MYVAIDKFTKWPEVESVRKVTAQSAVKFFKGLVCHFGVPNRVITDNGTQLITSRTFIQYIQDFGDKHYKKYTSVMIRVCHSRSSFLSCMYIHDKFITESR